MSSSSSSSDSTPFAFDFFYLLTREDSTAEESAGRNQPRVPWSFVLPSTMDDDEANEKIPVITAPSSESSAI